MTISLMYKSGRSSNEKFDVVDVDPYGSASVFIDSAVQAVTEGGLLCVTCTDTAVLCGNHVETCWSKYGSIALHTRYSHEMAVRLVLKFIESQANRYKRYIVPVLSLFVDFYVRVFVRVYSSPHTVKRSCTKMSQVFQCVGCDAFWLQRLCKTIGEQETIPKFTASTLGLDTTKCSECERPLKMGGPIWADPIHDQEFVKTLLAHIEQEPSLYRQSKKIYGLLTSVKDELPNYPFYYDLSSLSNTLHVNTPPILKMRSALMNAGYMVSGSHTKPGVLKTSAPNSVIFDIMRCWYIQHPSKSLRENSPAVTIVSKPPRLEANFELRKDDVLPSVPRFTQNPAFWGPGTRAGTTPSKRPPGLTKRAEAHRKQKRQKDTRDEEDYRKTNEERPCDA